MMIYAALLPVSLPTADFSWSHIQNWKLALSSYLLLSSSGASLDSICPSTGSKMAYHLHWLLRWQVVMYICVCAAFQGTNIQTNKQTIYNVLQPWHDILRHRPVILHACSTLRLLHSQATNTVSLSPLLDHAMWNHSMHNHVLNSYSAPWGGPERKWEGVVGIAAQF